MTSTFWEIKDDLSFEEMEDDLQILENGRRPKNLGK